MTITEYKNAALMKTGNTKKKKKKKKKKPFGTCVTGTLTRGCKALKTRHFTGKVTCYKNVDTFH
jgi:hypothetical protein